MSDLQDIEFEIDIEVNQCLLSKISKLLVILYKNYMYFFRFLKPNFRSSIHISSKKINNLERKLVFSFVRRKQNNYVEKA